MAGVEVLTVVNGDPSLERAGSGHVAHAVASAGVEDRMHAGRSFALHIATPGVNPIRIAGLAGVTKHLEINHWEDGFSVGNNLTSRKGPEVIRFNAGAVLVRPGEVIGTHL